MNLLPGRRAGWAALAAVVGALAVGGIAWADIPDSGVIHGCYKTVGGALRVIDADKGGECLSSEQALPWKQTGPTGPRGATGAKGATGPAGISDGRTNVAAPFTATNACEFVTVNSNALTLSQPSKLFLSATGVYSSNGNPDVSQAVVQVLVKDAASTTVGAISFAEVANGTGEGTYATAGIAGTPGDVSVPVTLVAGHYTIETDITTNGFCDPPEHGFVNDATLTYLLVGA